MNGRAGKIVWNSSSPGICDYTRALFLLWNNKWHGLDLWRCSTDFQQIVDVAKSRPIAALVVWKWLTAGKASKVWWETVEGLRQKTSRHCHACMGTTCWEKQGICLRNSSAHAPRPQLLFTSRFPLHVNRMNSNKLRNPFPPSAASSFPPLAQPCGNVTVAVCSMQIWSLHWSIVERMGISSTSRSASTPRQHFQNG